MHRLLLAILLGFLFATPSGGFADQRATVLALSLDGVVHPVTVDQIDKAILQARQERCELILIRLNTPGGFADATRAATEKLLNSPVPVAVWVGPAGARAASAGFFLLEAGDIAAMAPGTNTGAAHPVMLVGTADPTMMKKIESDAAASLRSVVARRGRNTELAEKAVFESKSFTDKEALTNSLVDVVAPSREDLLRQLHGRQVKRFDGSTHKLDLRDPAIIEYEPNLSQRVQSATADPNIALGVLLLGGLLLYVELTTPGLILPGVAGAIFVIVGLFAFAVLPVTWAGVLLLLLAIALFVLEAKITSHGVLAAGACVSMILGATLLIDSPIPELRIRWTTAVGLTLPFAIITVFLLTLVIRAKRSPIQSGAETFPGSYARALTECSPGGQVLFQGEIWNATATATVHPGVEVRVRSIHGLELEVEPISQEVSKAASAAAGG